MSNSEIEPTRESRVARRLGRRDLLKRAGQVGLLAAGATVAGSFVPGLVTPGVAGVKGTTYLAWTFPTSAAQWTLSQGGAPNHGSGGAWDRYVSPRDVIYLNNKWHMIYMGAQYNPAKGVADKQRALGIATTSGNPANPGSWTKHAGNPVITYSGPQLDSDWGVLSGYIGKSANGATRKYNNKFIMLYPNYDGNDSTIRWAESSDGFSWGITGETGITTALAGADKDEVWPAAVTYYVNTSTWYLFYTSGGPNNNRSLEVVTGTNPKSFSPSNRATVSISGESGDVHGGGKVFRDSGGWVMTYTTDDSNTIAVARSSNDDLTTWTKQGEIITAGSHPWLSAAGALTVEDNGDGTATWRYHTGYYDYDVQGSQYEYNLIATATVSN